MKYLLFLGVALLLVVVANSQYNASYAQGWCCKEDGQEPRQLDFQTSIKKFTIRYKTESYQQIIFGTRYRQVPIEGYRTVQLPVCLPSGIQCCQGYTILKGVCEKSDDIVCPGVITRLTSPDTGLGSVQLTINQETHMLKLPLGVYEYDFFLQGRNCSTTVKIADHRVLRRLEITTNYEVLCGVLTEHSISRTTVETTAQHNTKLITNICGNDCKVLDKTKAEIDCRNNTLTIRWLTDVTFPADVIKVPAELGQRIISRVLGDLSLRIFILNHAPPVVYPKKTESGSIIDLKLQSSCGEGNRLRYDALTDSCQG